MFAKPAFFRKRIITLFFALLLVVSSSLPFASSFVSAAPPQDFQTTPVVTSGLNGPSGFEIAPDGRIFVLERTGTIKIIKDGELLPTPFAELPSVASGDRGLIGIAFDPEFDVNCYVYFYYTSDADLLNYLVRFSACGDVGTDGPFKVFQTTTPSQELHVGGSIRFGADGKLYFAVGDNGYPPNAQDLGNAHGKIHRINKDGTIPTDNPFYGQSGVLQSIWAYGLRNPWRFQFDPATDEMYGGDVGDFSWEEVNHLQAGGNYGWPLKEGYCAPDCGDTIEPIYAYPHDGFSAAVTGGPVYRSDLFPEEYQGDLFFADYAMGFIKRMDLGPNGENLGVHDFDVNAGSVVDLKVAPDGSLYYLTYWPGRLYRVTYDTGNSVPVANASADITEGLAPLSINFSSAGSYDPDDGPLEYLWDFGDGTTSDEANPAKTYTENGAYTVELTVSDGQYSAQAVPLVVQVGSQPSVNISVPADGATYKAGDEITYNAFGLDGAGFDLNDSQLSTDVIFHHDTHTHPFLDDMIGRANSFTIPDHGEASPNTWYRIVTTATDDNGLTATDTVNIYPEKVQMTYQTNVPGIGVFIDGVPYANPYVTEGVVGFKRELSAAPIAKGSDGNYYQFEYWSDGGAIRHDITTPPVDTAYTAHYEPAPAFAVEYYDNENLEGAPVLTAEDYEINDDWGVGSPAAEVPDDQWSARYTKEQFFAFGRYKFTTATDDGVRLYIDGELLIDQWVGQNQAHSITIDLTEGMHEIRMEYMEQFGGAYARLNWNTTTDQPEPLGEYTAEFFNNIDLSGAPALTRIDQSIDYDWGGGSPDPVISVDNFSARWTKTEAFQAGLHEFTVTADDGVRLYIDGTLVLDKWIDQAPTTYTVTRNLAAGDHVVTLEYYEKGGGAVARLSHQLIEPATGGYAAKYWNVPELGFNPEMPETEPDLTRTDEAIDFAWGSGSPDPAIALDKFMAEWTMSEVFAAGTYSFTVRSDDGIRVYVDDAMIIDRWFDQGGQTEHSVNLDLAAGEHDIKVEYYENGGGAIAEFDYEQVNIPGFTAKYWNIAPFGDPVIPETEPDLTRTDDTIDFDWGGSSPASVIDPDYFAAQWTRTELIDEAGAYEFTVTADDGVRLYIDDELILDQWVDQAPTTYTVTKDLAAGEHDIKVEYYEKAGGAVARLSYEQVEASPPPQDYPTVGYTGRYWNFAAGTLPEIPATPADLLRSDAAIDFDWGGGSPGGVIGLDNFVARWQHHNHTPGTYRFTVTSDDGVRLYIDDELILDEWNDHAATTYVVEATLEEHWSLTLEYYEKGGGALAQFDYELIGDPGEPSH